MQSPSVFDLSWFFRFFDWLDAGHLTPFLTSCLIFVSLLIMVRRDRKAMVKPRDGIAVEPEDRSANKPIDQRKLLRAITFLSVLLVFFVGVVLIGLSRHSEKPLWYYKLQSFFYR